MSHFQVQTCFLFVVIIHFFKTSDRSLLVCFKTLQNWWRPVEQRKTFSPASCRAYCFSSNSSRSSSWSKIVDVLNIWSVLVTSSNMPNRSRFNVQLRNSLATSKWSKFTPPASFARPLAHFVMNLAKSYKHLHIFQTGETRTWLLVVPHSFRLMSNAVCAGPPAAGSIFVAFDAPWDYN